MIGNQRDSQSDSGVDLLVRTKKKTVLKKPGKYVVVLINDDYTPMEFVVWILQTIFHKNMEEAGAIMLEAHTNGKAVIGTYSLDVAKTYVKEVRHLADQNDYPLEVRVEKAMEE